MECQHALSSSSQRRHSRCTIRQQPFRYDENPLPPWFGHRYGRKMQTIAGIHYNFSLPPALWDALFQLQGGEGKADKDFITDSYFALIRNFRRYSWLLIYLFGAAPAVSKCL